MEHIKNNGQQVMSVRTPEGFVRKSTWQVADVTRPLVSASHIVVNRRRKEKFTAQEGGKRVRA